MIQITEITVAQLPDFVGSSDWQRLNPKPVTLLRAISQFHNPRANPNDIALIIATENNELIGLVGILPDLLNGRPEKKAYSNTCWWVHPEKGKQLAVPLFLKAFAACGQRMFMTDCTPHTIHILQKTNWFVCPSASQGMRGFLKFNLNELLPAKIPSLRKLAPILKLTDRVLNLLIIPWKEFVRKRLTKNPFQAEIVDVLDQELCQFIEAHSQNEFTRRTGKEIEWILKFPWIKQKRNSPAESPVNYPFSYLVENFEQYLLRITESGKTTGLLLISVRDGHMKVPYAYFDEVNASQVITTINLQALMKNVTTLTIFNPALVQQAEKEANPFIFRKKIKRLIAVSKSLADEYQEFPVLQDGDGDVVFT